MIERLIVWRRYGSSGIKGRKSAAYLSIFIEKNKKYSHNERITTTRKWRSYEEKIRDLIGNRSSCSDSLR